MKNIQIWKPIEFDENLWQETDCSVFHELEPSWIEKREEFKKNNTKEYEEFLNRLKRQHAIETGVIEKLYDISEGITQTFIKEGFVESLISHNDTNISSKQLLNYLKSHFDAMDFVFDIVKNNKLFFPMWFIFVFFVFNNDLVYFGAPFIVITIIFGIMYYIPPMRKKLYNPEIKLFDKGIFIEGYGHLKWNNFKGYYKKGGHIYLVLSYGFSKMVHSLKYNNKVENIIKSHLKEIK